MKIFLTGGTGFIGSHFLKRALADGHEVIAQRRPGSKTRLPLLQQPVWIERDLDKSFENEIADCDVVVHLASHTPNPPYASLDECMYWNVFATTNLLQQAAAQGVRDVLVAGTCFEYGMAAEGMDYVHPATEMQPKLTYPISKATSTTACLGIARHLDLRLKILRIFQVYGEGEAPTRFWPSLREAAINGRDFPMSSGEQIRDFINVEKVVEKFIEELKFEGVEHGRPQIMNVGTGHGQTLLSFAKHWWKEFQASGKLQPGKISKREGEIYRLVANVHEKHIC